MDFSERNDLPKEEFLRFGRRLPAVPSAAGNLEANKNTLHNLADWVKAGRAPSIIMEVVVVTMDASL